MIPVLVLYAHVRVDCACKCMLVFASCQCSYDGIPSLSSRSRSLCILKVLPIVLKIAARRLRPYTYLSWSGFNLDLIWILVIKSCFCNAISSSYLHLDVG